MQNGLQLYSETVRTMIFYIFYCSAMEILHSVEFETQNTAHFKTFMDSLNVIQNILPNTISQIWATASALTVSKSQYRDSYVKRLIPATTNHRAVIRALNHTALREAVDTLIKIPFFEVTVANFAHWTSLGGFSVLH